MHYLNHKERRMLGAVDSYAPRKLTKIEQVIKHLGVVCKMEPGKAKDDEAAQTIRILGGLTSSPTLLARARLAIYNEEILREVTEQYPYVEFEGLINQDINHQHPPLVKAALRNLSVGELQTAVKWLDKFKALLNELPTKFGETYISTPNTNYSMVRTKATVHGEKAAFGLQLRADLQARVNELFENSQFYNHPAKLVHEYELDKIDNIHQRLKMEVPEVQTNEAHRLFTLTFWVDEIPTKIFERENPVSRTITVFRTDYPIVNEDSVKAQFHFQY